MKRFYVVLFIVLCVSVVLLGFSFSKESGSNNELSFLNEVATGEYRVVFSPSNEINTVKNKSVLVSVVNKSANTSDIYVTLKEIDGKQYKNVFYKVNNGPEHVMVENTIKLGSLEAFKTDGDHNVFNLEVYTKDDTEYNFEVFIGNKEVVVNTLGNVIKGSNQVYTDKDGNVRYYGTEVNNYILYNGEVHRIIGIVNNKVKIISDIKELGVYDTSKGEYATLEDYFGTYNNVNVNSSNVLEYKSWINSKGFWLLEEDGNKAYFGSASYGVDLYLKNTSYYLRYVQYIDSDALLNFGDGTINSPYEVSYGS